MPCAINVTKMSTTTKIEAKDEALPIVLKQAHPVPYEKEERCH